MVNAPIVVDIIVVPDGISDVQRKQRGQYVNKLLPTAKLAGQRDRKKFNPDHSLEIFMKRYKLQLSAYAYQLLGDYDAVEDDLATTSRDNLNRINIIRVTGEFGGCSK